MINKTSTIVYTSLFLCLITGAAFAHHSTRGIYHDDQMIEVTGVVKSWRFINPHPYLTVEVTADDGTINEWDVSYGGAAVVHLKRQGYSKDTFTAGDIIVIHGNPAKAKGAYGILIEGDHPTWPDGSPIVEGGSYF